MVSFKLTGSSSSSVSVSCRRAGSGFTAAFLPALAVLFFAAQAAPASEEKAPAGSPADSIRAIQGEIDLHAIGLIPMIDNNAWRYSTTDSWARKAVGEIYGPRDFYDLDPVLAAMEIMFNGGAYRDEPIIFVKDLGVLRDLTKHPIQITDAQRDEIYKSRHVSPGYLARPDVAQRLEELSGEVMKNKAMGRLSRASYHYQRLPNLWTIVPCPSGKRETPWISVVDLLDAKKRADAGLTDAAAQGVIEAYRDFGRAWIDRDAKGINAGAERLARLLPTLAPADVYPTEKAREVEMSYRRMELIRKGWFCYIFAFFISIFAVATRYRWARAIGLAVLLGAIGLHGYDLWLRWQVVGRVPVANMYEAVVSSAWMASVFALLLELFTKKRVFLLASAFMGFFALALPELLPDEVNNNIQTMMPILDDVMLRIHTTLIIASYGVITLAFAVANCYLFTSAIRDKVGVAQATIGAEVGAIACLVLAYKKYFELPTTPAAWLLRQMGVHDEPVLLTLQFIITMALAVIGAALLARGLFAMIGGRAADGRGAGINVSDFPIGRGVLEEFDLAHRVLLYTAMVALFIGIVLGAMWADYSWGRPWGWDPKEVFALNTWLVYAILIHARFVTKRRALWTSVLSVAGFAAMQFNWWVVNFYIVGLHSYA